MSFANTIQNWSLSSQVAELEKRLDKLIDLVKKEHDGSFSEMEPISNHDYNAELQLI